MSMRFKEYSLAEKILSIIAFVAFLAASYTFGDKYMAMHHKEVEAYERIKANSRHVKID